MMPECLFKQEAREMQVCFITVKHMEKDDLLRKEKGKKTAEGMT